MTQTLWSMRCDYQIKYFNRNRKKLLASSNIITVDKDQPLQPHLSLTLNSPYEMRLIWNSIQYEYYTNNTEYEYSTAIVKLGVSSNNYNKIYTNNNNYTYSYDTINMCQYEAAIHDQQHYRDPGYFYDVMLHERPFGVFYIL